MAETSRADAAAGTVPPRSSEARPLATWLPLPRLTGSARVWALSALMAVAGMALLLGWVVHLPTVPVPFAVPWWVLAVAFYVAEVSVIHLQFRREAHTFSLSEIPLVAGLFLLSPADFVLANVIGAAAALAFHRRQSLIKLSFNSAAFLFEAVVAVTVFHLLGGFSTGGSLAQPTVWLATFAATVTVNIVGVAVIAAAIALSEGRLETDKLPQVLRFALAVGLTNTSLALIGITILFVSPAMLWLLAVPVVLLFMAYRSYMLERAQHESLEFLYESARILQRSPELDSNVLTLIGNARRMFRSEFAEITLFPARDGERPLRTSLGPDDHTELMVPVTIELDDTLHVRAMGESQAFLYEAPHHPGIGRDGPPSRARIGSGLIGETPERIAGRRPAIRNAMVTMMRLDGRVMGMMVVANRLGDVGSYRTEDLRLFELLASHTAAALENGRLGESLVSLSELKEKLRHQAFHDSLTGLGNRPLFKERVEQALARHQDGVRVPVVMFIDLDDFKTVNDSLGHAAGDDLLKAVSLRIRNCLRPGDLAVRLGGDEFAVLIEDTRDIGPAIRVTERIIDALHAPFMVDGQDVSIQASIGIAAARSGTESADELLRDADVAMYTAKARGKGRYAMFETTMHTRVVERHELKADLERAVARGEFVLRYQPILSLDTGHIEAVEALIRWNHPLRGEVQPSEFITIAEETGLILPIGHWVLEEACRALVAWRRELSEGCGMSVTVNLSPRQVQQAGFIDEVAEIIARTGVPAEQLVLEITEGLMMHDTTTTVTKLRALKGLGVKLAVDDFGTGYSSLSHLRSFPVDVLKIAREFVVSDPESVQFAEMIVALGHSRHLTVIAEGIEQLEQLERLRAMGCDSGQGFYFAHPVDAATISHLLHAGPVIAGAEQRPGDRRPLIAVPRVDRPGVQVDLSDTSAA
jgi:diguanylate cyclase (GGDEF)-like protein